MGRRHAPRGRKAASALGILGLWLGGLSLGCDRPPDPTGEWSPFDHDHPPSQGQGQAQSAPSGSATRMNAQQQLIEAAWAQTCATCHGPLGHGDGPQGSLVHAPDLTREDWQAKVTDEEIATRIRQG